MSDRLNETQRHRPAGAAPARPRPQARQQPPLASLQAAAGNRAVTTAIQRATGTPIQRAAGTPIQRAAGTPIQRAAGTPIQRAAGTAPLPEAPAQERAPSSSAHDLEITPVAETAQPDGETHRMEDATAGRQAAVDEVAEQKTKVSEASRARADAAADVWTWSGTAVEARKKETAARGRAEELEGEVGTAKRGERESRERAQSFTTEANVASDKQRGSLDVARRHGETEARKGEAAKEAREQADEFSKQAEAAEQRRKTAQDLVDALTTTIANARRSQAEAEEKVRRFTRQAEESAAELKAADEAARKAGAVEDKAQEQAAEAEVEAESEEQFAQRMRKRTVELAQALKGVKNATEEARGKGEEAERAGDSRTEADGDQEEATRLRDEANQNARESADLAEKLDREARAATEVREAAEQAAAGHERDAKDAHGKAEKAQAEAAGYAKTAGDKQTERDAALAKATEHGQEAAEARRRAAAAAQGQLTQGATETAARTALTAAKETEKKAAEKKAAEAAEKKTGEAAEKTGGAPGNVATRAVEGAGHAVKKASAKTKPWADIPDTAALRATAPPGGVYSAEASKHGDTGTVRGNVIQQNVENPINLISDATGTVNDIATIKEAAGKRHESGPASHAHRKNWVGKPLGLATNSQMAANDVLKISNTGTKTAGDVAGVAALGDAGGALTISFSALVAARDTMVIKNTHAQRKELKEHFRGVAAKRDRKLQDVLDDLGAATVDLAQTSSRLDGSDADAALATVEERRARVESLRTEVLEHMASAREYVVHKKKWKLGHRFVNLTGNVARMAAGGVAIAAASGAVTGGIAVGVAGGATAAALGGLAVKKGVKKANKRYISVRQPDRYGRTTLAQEGTEESETAETAEASEASRMSKDGTSRRGRRRDAWKEAFMVSHPIKQGKRQLRAQEIYAAAAGPAVPVGKNVPDDIRNDAREFLKALKCGPDKHNQDDDAWAASLNDPEQQKEWEEAIAKQLASL
ncbi:hypothetical protein [Streptomyces sp. MH60]|uniref:hypothetical protein n=1 Tax=Streptomyces sp. MH60 TaxID=1940758 RepID=UPI000CEE780A|nr:hypothetical protein [Streptomyces sp. MH60]PPS69670.1 hypothetical protein BZZ08_07288 [Streptomyces sp. MH60]